MTLASLTLASTLVSAAPLSTVSNASASLIAGRFNASLPSPSHKSGCDVASIGIRGWYYNTRSNGPHICYGDDFYSWSMTSTYRSGGTENVHWKYTEDKNDFDCLYDWKWYAVDGTRLVATIRGRLAAESDGRHWCGLHVYRSGGVEDYQWKWCKCWH